LGVFGNANETSIRAFRSHPRSRQHRASEDHARLSGNAPRGRETLPGAALDLRHPGVLILGGSLGYYLLYPSGESPLAQEEIPPVLRPYLDRAGQGDPSAMRMLGTMYYNGLNVRKDRKEGIKWYRKAAAAGSVAAKKDLEQLGLAESAPSK